MNDMVTLILIASMALWKISPHVINVSIIRILTARLVAVVCYYVSVHCVGPSEHLGTVEICPNQHLKKAMLYLEPIFETKGSLQYREFSLYANFITANFITAVFQNYY